jgi:plastocyanin
MAGSRSRRSEALLFLALVIVAAAVIVGVSLALRSSGDTSSAQTAGATAAPDAETSSVTTKAVASASAKPQICASCWGDGGPDPTVRGDAEVVDGVQVVRIGVEGGYYVPNEFTVQAGVPVTVEFSGSAEGCLAEPEFPDLGVRSDFSGGSTTMELGVLDPGTYVFTCSMGVNEGHITVE